MIISEVLISKAEICVKRLREDGLIISFAESCTGGILSYLFSIIPGVSGVFDCAIVAYSNGAKNHFLGLTPEYVKTYGIVSKEVAAKMAEGVIRERQVDIAISTTGVAGKRTQYGGTEIGNEEQVGTVFIGKARKNQHTTTKLLSLGDMPRYAIQQRAAEAALDLII
ncbi:MAG: CinA family protein [Aaplasma endosymbiont of Hyalomma asiaticum]